MKQLFKLLSIMGLMAFTLSCEEEVDPGKLGLQDQLLVVNSIISPDQDTLSVQVSWSQPLFGELPEFGSDDDLVTDAVVTISNGEFTVNLNYSEEHQLYRVRTGLITIQEGRTYTLQVTAGDVTTTATTTVPMAVPISNLRITPTPNFESRVVMSWMDPVAETNFYRVTTTLQSEEGRLANTVFYDEEEFHSDIATNGAGISARGEMYYSGDFPEFNLLVGLLFSCDENYYLYHRNRNRFEDDDPFSEPTITHSNIEGGTGIFASYVSSRFVLTLD